MAWYYRDNISSAVLLKRASGQNDAEYYVYDSAGQRVRKVRETLTNSANNTLEIEEKIYLGGVEIKKISTVRGNSITTILNRSTLHVMDDKKRIAVVHNWTMDNNNREVNSSSDLNVNKTRYQFGNHLDSASLELDPSGNIITYEEYFPYGDTSFVAGTNQKEVKLKEYRYTGKEKDDATGLYYYGARYYASWCGRWLSCDPLFRENPAVYEKPKAGDEEERKKQEEGFKQKLFSEGLNLYCYVKGNPISFSDPTGKEGVLQSVGDWLNTPGPVTKYLQGVGKELHEEGGKLRDWIDDENKAKAVGKALGVSVVLTVLNTLQALGFGALSIKGVQVAIGHFLKTLATKKLDEKVRNAIIAGIISGFATVAGNNLNKLNSGKEISPEENLKMFKTGFIYGFAGSLAGSLINQETIKNLTVGAIAAAGSYASQLESGKEFKDVSKTTMFVAALLSIAGLKVNVKELSSLEKAITGANLAVIKTSLNKLIGDLEKMSKENKK